MTRRRVVVTGLGCISPVGNTVAESWANLLAGKPGIDLITQFDASNFACKFAGEVKGFTVNKLPLQSRIIMSKLRNQINAGFPGQQGGPRFSHSVTHRTNAPQTCHDDTTTTHSAILEKT